MNEFHEAYLGLGSNIQPELNLPRAVQLLSEYAEVRRVSNAWESRSVGAPGQNYLNACVLFMSPIRLVELKEQVIRPIEARLGRARTADKLSPRTIDIDIILFDDQPYNETIWDAAFVVLPLSEIHPEYRIPTTGENVVEAATRVRREVWIAAHPDVLSQFSGDQSGA